MGHPAEEGGGGEGAQAAGEEEQRGEAVTWRIKTVVYISYDYEVKPLEDNHIFLQNSLFMCFMRSF